MRLVADTLGKVVRWLQRRKVSTELIRELFVSQHVSTSITFSERDVSSSRSLASARAV